MFEFELTSVPLQFLRITFTYLAGFAIELGNSTIYKKTSWGIKSASKAGIYQLMVTYCNTFYQITSF